MKCRFKYENMAKARYALAALISMAAEYNNGEYITVIKRLQFSNLQKIMFQKKLRKSKQPCGYLLLKNLTVH